MSIGDYQGLETKLVIPLLKVSQNNPRKMWSNEADYWKLWSNRGQEYIFVVPVWGQNINFHDSFISGFRLTQKALHRAQLINEEKIRMFAK